jgi:hypothetical protein
MSKERELLESCLDEFQYQSFPCTELVTRIKELLAQPKQEPSDTEIITAYQMLVRRKLGLQEKNEVLLVDKDE